MRKKAFIVSNRIFKYGATTNPIKRLGLHAWVLSFNHPVTKEAMRFETEVPQVFLGLF